MEFTFDYNLFILQFPEFNDPIVYPQSLLQMYWNLATDYISTNDYGPLNGISRRDALNLLTAHLAYLFFRIDANKATGVVTQASIDKVSVTTLPPPINSAFDYWLNQSPYGKMLLALLDLKGTLGGDCIGGSVTASAFRSADGSFPNYPYGWPG